MTYAETRPAFEVPLPDEPVDPWDLDGFTQAASVPGTARSKLAGRILNRDDLCTLPAPQPLISNTLDLGTVAVLAGYYGTLKSFIALDWSCCVGTGFAWHARAVQPGRVLYIAAEGAYGLNQRISAWEQHRRTKVPPDTFDVLPEAVNLGHAADVQALRDTIQRRGYRLVVVDTLAKSLAGMDENSSRDMGIAVSALYSLRGATRDGTVLVVHHTGKDRTTIRGSSALEAGVDTVHTTEGDAGSLTLSRTKRKDGPCEDVMSLLFEPVPGTDSGIVSSHLGVRQSARAETLMSHFQSHFGETGATPTQLIETTGMPKATVHRALNDLLKTGELRNVGTRTRPRYEAPR